MIRHKVFNPAMHLDALRLICEEMEGLDLELIRVVPVHAYESVAVFHGEDIKDNGE